MANQQPIPLTAIPVAPGDTVFRDLVAWPFPEQPFYEAQIRRVLETDIPHRVMYSNGLMWVYRDPDGHAVGVGTLDLCKEYARLTGGLSHYYIPVLGVHPLFQRRGHGRSIVQHLIDEARVRHRANVEAAQGEQCEVSDALFLDVYSANRPAIALYEKLGFAILNPDAAERDAEENNEPYVIMAKRLSPGS